MSSPVKRTEAIIHAVRGGYHEAPKFADEELAWKTHIRYPHSSIRVTLFLPVRYI
jgi:hypothetical protein